MSEIFHRWDRNDDNDLFVNYIPFISGSVAGAFSRTLCCPIDVIKIISQVEPRRLIIKSYIKADDPRIHVIIYRMVQKEGLLSLWKGNLPGMIMNAIYGGIQFTALPYLLSTIDESQKFFNPSTKPNESTPENGFVVLLASATASIIATLASYPLDILRTKLAVNSIENGSTFLNGSLKNTVLKTSKLEGLRGFYSGINFSIFYASVSTSTVLFSFYKLTHNNKLNDGESTYRILLYGSISGFVSKLLVTPLDVIKKRLQTKGPQIRQGQNSIRLPPITKSAFDTAYNIAKNEGVMAFYKGSIPAILKSSIMTPTNLWCFNFVSTILRKIHNSIEHL